MMLDNNQDDLKGKLSEIIKGIYEKRNTNRNKNKDLSFETISVEKYDK